MSSNVPGHEFQDSHHLRDLRLVNDWYLVVRRFKAGEIDVRLPRESLAHEAKAFRRGWRSQNLSGKKCSQILAVAYHRNRNVRKSNVAPIYLSATSRPAPLLCRND